MYVLEFIGATVFLASLIFLLLTNRRYKPWLQALMMFANLLAFIAQAWARHSEGTATTREIAYAGGIYLIVLLAIIIQTIYKNTKHKRK